MFEKRVLAVFNDKNTGEYDRVKIGYFSGIVGIFLNSFLTISKFIFGLLTNSIAIMADAINNLTDVMSSVITILGFKIANSPADKNHPYGHGRAEYITTFIISIIILFVGFQFTKNSIERIINPKEIKISTISMVFLLLSIIIKFFMSWLNKKLGRAIDSDLLVATSYDSLTDCFTTSIVLLSAIWSKYNSIPVDAFIGLLISGYIVYSGFKIAKETVSFLLGESPDDELILNVVKEIEKYDMVLGTHKLKFHNYGQGKIFATVDVEFDANTSFVKVHNIVSVIEKEIFEKYKISLAIHAEPVGGEFTDNEKQLKSILDEYLFKFKFVKSIHDFAIYKYNEQNFVVLEIVIDANKVKENLNEKVFTESIKKIIREYDNELNIIIKLLNEYV